MNGVIKLGMGIVTIVAVTVGGFYIKQSVSCSRLEEDYLNSIASLKQAATLRSIARSSKEGLDAANAMERIGFSSAELSLNQIYRQCGVRSGQSAARKGSSLVLD